MAITDVADYRALTTFNCQPSGRRLSKMPQTSVRGPLAFNLIVCHYWGALREHGTVEFSDLIHVQGPFWKARCDESAFWWLHLSGVSISLLILHGHFLWLPWSYLSVYSLPYRRNLSNLPISCFAFSVPPFLKRLNLMLKSRLALNSHSVSAQAELSALSVLLPWPSHYWLHRLWPLPLSYCLLWNGRVGTDSFVHTGFPYSFLFWGSKHSSPCTCLKPEGHKRLPITRNEKGINGTSCYQVIINRITAWAC